MIMSHLEDTEEKQNGTDELMRLTQERKGQRERGVLLLHSTIRICTTLFKTKTLSTEVVCKCFPRG